MVDKDEMRWWCWLMGFSKREGDGDEMMKIESA